MAKEKGLYKRGNIYWLRYAGPDGRIYFESTGKSDFKEAKDILIDKRKEIKDIRDGKEIELVKKIPNHTFKELSNNYLEWAERQKGIRSKKGIIKILVDQFGNVQLKSFNTWMIEEYQSQMLKNKKADATCNRHLATLKHMINKAVEWEMVPETVLKKVRKVKQLKENNERLRFLTVEEIQDLISACPLHLKPIVITALNTGMRKEEILSLEWDRHVDLKHGFILLDKTKNGKRRELPINGTLKEVLKGLKELVKPVIDIKTGETISPPYVFRDKEGKRFKDVKRSFTTACIKAGIKDFRFHDLRHTFASQLIMAGVDLATVRDLLGHKDIKMTLRYSHLAPSHKARAVDILDQTFTGRPTIQKLYSMGGQNG
jgi:integrase